MKKNFILPVASLVAAITLVGVASSYEVAAAAIKKDTPPKITVTWKPAGTIDLAKTKIHLNMKDDNGLNFKTYRFTVKEMGKTWDMPIDGGMVGKEYDTDLSLSWLASSQAKKLNGKTKLTLVFSIEDTKKQKTTLTKTINIKKIVAPKVAVPAMKK